jgi:hypothetical protein
MFTIIIGAPLLLAIAIQFIEIITRISAQANLGNAASIGLALFSGEIIITTDFLFKTSIILIILTGLLASMLIGVIQEGKMKDGMKLAPIIIIATFAVFFIAKNLIGTMF